MRKFILLWYSWRLGAGLIATSAFAFEFPLQGAGEG